MLGVQGVPQKYGRHRAATGVHAVDALRSLFSSGAPVDGGSRGSVTAI